MGSISAGAREPAGKQVWSLPLKGKLIAETLLGQEIPAADRRVLSLMSYSAAVYRAVTCVNNVSPEQLVNGVS